MPHRGLPSMSLNICKKTDKESNGKLKFTPLRKKFKVKSYHLNI